MANENVYVGETGAKQLYQRVKGLVSGTIPRVDGAVEGNISVLAGDGSLTDSGISGSSVGDALSKLEGIEPGAQVNLIESVEVAGTALVITGKAVNIPDADVSVKGVVRLTSDPTSEAENTAATPEAIRRALANFGGFMVVQLDPETRQPAVDSPSTKYIYLTKEGQSAKTDPYTEWIWIEPDSGEPYWDVIGEASVDLSGYVQKVSGATEGNLGSLAADGGLADSGISGNSVGDALSKIGGIESGAQVNIIESISVNGTAVNPDANKNVAISIPKSVPDPSAANQMLFSTDGATWVPMTWEMVVFNPNDIGGRTYRTVTIGNQIWLAENLDYKFDYNGSELPVGVSGYPSTPAAWYYTNEETYGIDGTRKCGLMYNWYAAKYLDDHKATLLPPGWHVPTQAEWFTLAETVTESIAGYLLKALDNATGDWPTGWNGNDEYGFGALPGGMRLNGGSSFDVGDSITYWTKEESSADGFTAGFTKNSPKMVQGSGTKENGCYIRLVKDA